MESKSFSLGKTIDTDDQATVIYYVNPDAVYAEISMFHMSNTSNQTHTATLSFRYSEKKVSNHFTFWGDGTTRKQEYFTYPSTKLLKEVTLHANAALSVTDRAVFANPKDFFTVLPTSVGAEENLDTIITVTEYYESKEALEASTAVDLDSVNSRYSAGTL